MRKIVILLAVFVWVAGIALADSIYMRDGSQVQGIFLGFEDGYFMFQVSNGQQVKYAVRQVSRLVIDQETAFDDTYRRFPGRDSGATPSSGASRSVRGRNEKVITLAGNQEWVDTGIDLASNMTLDITSEGQIRISSSKRAGPDGNRDNNSSCVNCPMENVGVGAVIAKVRYRNGTESAVRLIGRHNATRIGSGEVGRLYLGINDNEIRDNTGSYRVTIQW